jgi:hypothetical protein
MPRNVLLAGLLGGLAMFVWSFIAHMALPLGEAGIRQIDREEVLLSTMRTDIPDHGLYMFPKMPPGMTEAQYGERIASGPSGLMVYFPRRDFSFGASLGVEFLTQVLQALIASYLVWRIRPGSFGGRLGIYAFIGLVSVISTNVSYANWYGFPIAYTLAYMFTIWMGFFCAGLVGAGMKLGQERAATAAA